MSGAIVAVIIAALAGFIVGKVFAGPAKRNAGGGGDNAPIMHKIDRAKAAKLATEGDPPAKGPDSAKVKVVIFSDFMCGFCGQMAPAFAGLSRKFGDRVQIVYRTFPLEMHKGADLSAEAALAANEQGKFWEYHDILFGHMGSQSRSDLESYAQQLGLDMNAFRAALDTHKFKPAVDASVALGKSIGVGGTPTVVINDAMVMNFGPGALAGMVQRALDGKPPVDRMPSSGAGAEGGGERQAAGPQKSREAPPLPAESVDVKVEPWNPSRGPANAKVQIVLFCEYLCPFCKKIQPTLDVLQKYYGNDVRIVFRNWIVHEPATILSKAVLAAGLQGKFEELHKLFFDNQGEIRVCYESQDDCRVQIDKFAGMVPGLDLNRLHADMEGPEVQSRLDADHAAGQAAGAQGTPSPFVNGRKAPGAVPPTFFGKWMDQILGRSTPTIPASEDPQQQGQQAGCGQ
ncbi:MAG: thioredoxin domain-containing protein [Deltaproteobacteria bacterium]|nr:thioredoxin domain-containing protein [Deltaproteobacteria bacterium]